VNHSRSLTPITDRTIAIGDIHGCSLALAALIDAIQPGAGDILVPLGDYVDRGIDSRGVLEQMTELARRCRLVPLLGNHDRMLLDAVTGDDRHGGWYEHKFHQWLEFGGITTLDSYGDGVGVEAIPPDHVAFLQGCRDYYETDTHIFVHANYRPDLRMDEHDEWVLRWESLRDRVPGPHRSGKTVILGHTSRKDGEILDLGHLKCIDTYCCGGGWLTALDVRTGQVWQSNERGDLRR
jgi:serine/threonine protein phosphatase 1